MRVLITGAAGFIGGHTAERLLRRGDDVTVVDCVNSYYDPAVKRATLEILRRCADESKGTLTIHEVDLRDLEKLKTICRDARIEVYCHLAAQAGVRYSIEHVAENIATNITGTTNILECARDLGARNVVCASSSSVYGESSVAPFSEDQVCDRPISPYAACKRADELFGHVFHHLYKMPVTMLRFFTVYGPRGRPDMACFKFIDRITRGVAIDKYGDGSMIREFTYVDDIVDGVVSAIDTVSPWEVVNLGGGSTHTLNDLISTIEKHVGKQAVINPLPNQPGDVQITSADQKNAKRVLKFQPKVSLDEGVRRTVDWYNEWSRAKRQKTSPSPQ